MTSKEDFLRTLHGVSTDGRIPQKTVYVPTNLEGDPDGFITLYGGGQEIQPDTIVTTNRFGPTLLYENTNNPDDPYLFTQGGYEIKRNTHTGEYTYTIHPTYDFDFAFLDRLSELEKKNALILMEAMRPTITIENTLSKETDPTTRIGIGRNDLELFRVHPKRTCPSFITNVSVNYREELGKIHVVSALSNILTVAAPLGKKYYKPLLTAEIAEPTESVRFVLNDLAEASGKYPPRVKDITSFANATLSLSEFDPFEHYTL